MTTSKRAMLIIMDGWGHGKVPASDAIAHAKTPFVSSLYNKYPQAELVTCGFFINEKLKNINFPNLYP